MDWKKSSAELVEFFAGAMAPFACQKKQMFGYPVCFVNGYMFAGLLQDDLFVRLSEADRKALFSSSDEATFLEPMPGRPMRDYVVLPASLYDDPAVLREWLDRSFRYASSLPPKETKKEKKA